MSQRGFPILHDGKQSLPVSPQFSLFFFSSSSSSFSLSSSSSSSAPPPGLADCLENFDSDKEDFLSSDTEEERVGEKDSSGASRGDRSETSSQRLVKSGEEEEKASPGPAQVGTALENRGRVEDQVEELTRRRNGEQVDGEEAQEGRGGKEDSPKVPDSINDGDVESDDDDEEVSFSGSRAMTRASIPLDDLDASQALDEHAAWRSSVEDRDRDDAEDAVSISSGVVELQGAVSRLSGVVGDSQGASEASEAEEALDIS